MKVNELIHMLESLGEGDKTIGIISIGIVFDYKIHDIETQVKSFESRSGETILFLIPSRIIEDFKGE